ncbi:porin [Consotaella salsifontis]|uniref:Porin n=1 Tax=Consotaella salsifontis TaxID=1365950 RepID=A0A1T4T661_9HYPH|nr:porin [Consotaella salsifontis]SKA35942.1 Porin subfamily protein [Consotaella salsifontis]
MNIKSLLLGSAAALVAVSGARAADAVVMAEPEPVDYVRVCDVYGAGFFYIPGTETCIKFGGLVRMDFKAASDTSVLNDEGDDYNVYTRVRARLNIDVREQTELGELQSYIRFQATNTSGASNDVGMDQAYVNLGGFTIGKQDSLFTWNDGFYTDEDLPVGDISVNRVGYTFAANGFEAAVSLEDDGSLDAMPDVVGSLKYGGAWGSVYVAGVYDENTDNMRDYAAGSFSGYDLVYNPATGNVDAVLTGYNYIGLDPNGDYDDAFAVKAGIEVSPWQDAKFKVEGSWASDPTNYSTNDLYYGLDQNEETDLGFDPGDVPVEWQVGAGYGQSFGKVNVALSGVYGKTFDLYGFDGTGALVNYGDADYYKLVGDVGYNFTKNFFALAEVSYTNLDPDGFDDIDQTQGFLRLQRNF